MSNERLNLELRGSIFTVTPFANSPESRGKKGKDDSQGLPRMSVWSNGQMRSNVLFIPASAIRGMLRRAAANEVADRFNQGGPIVKFSEWLLWSIGGVKGSGEDKNCHPMTRHKYIEGNPLVALFGAGKADSDAANIGGMVGSKLHIAHAVLNPNDNGEVQPTPHKSARAHENRSPRLPWVLPPEELEVAHEATLIQGESSALDKEIKKMEMEMRRKKKGGEETEELARTLEEKKKKLAESNAIREKLETGNSIGRTLPGYETIPPGIAIPHRMTLTGVTHAQAGLFFAALRRFGRNPFLGAHRAHDCGRVYCDYVVWRRDDNGNPTKLGALTVGEKNHADPEPQPFFIPEAESELAALIQRSEAEWEKVEVDALRPYRGEPNENSGADGEAKKAKAKGKAE